MLRLAAACIEAVVEKGNVGAGLPQRGVDIATAQRCHVDLRHAHVQAQACHIVCSACVRYDFLQAHTAGAWLQRAGELGKINPALFQHGHGNARFDFVAFGVERELDIQPADKHLVDIEVDALKARWNARAGQQCPDVGGGRHSVEEGRVVADDDRGVQRSNLYRLRLFEGRRSPARCLVHGFLFCPRCCTNGLRCAQHASQPAAKNRMRREVVATKFVIVRHRWASKLAGGSKKQGSRKPHPLMCSGMLVRTRGCGGRAQKRAPRRYWSALTAEEGLADSSDG